MKTTQKTKWGWRDWTPLAILILFCVAAVPLTVQYMITYDSVADMASNHNPASLFKSAYVRGYYGPGDGGGGWFYATNSVTGTNIGTRIASFKTGWSMDRHHDGELNVRWFGARGNGTSSDTTAVQAAHDAISTTQPQGLYFPPADWKFNLVVTKSNVKIRGSSHMVDFNGTMTSRFFPANNASPVIQVGNDSGYVKGFILEDATIDGRNLGSVGLYLAGGAFEATVRNTAVVYFTNCVKALGGTTYPASLIWFDRLDVQPGNLTGARGLLFTQTSNYPTSWTTAIFVRNTHVGGPAASVSNGYAMEVDSVGVYIGDTYFDVHDDHGVKLSKSQSPVPFLYCNNFALDSSPATGAALESYSNNRYFVDQMSGQFSIAGKWKLLDGTLLTPPQGALRQNASLLYPQVHGTLNLVELNNGSFTGDNYTNFQALASGGHLWFKSAGSIKADAASGVFQIDGENSTGAGYLNIADNVNGKTVVIQGLNGSINLRAVAGGAIRFQDTLGNTRGQINANGGWFVSDATANTSAYFDTNKQLKSAPTGTATLDFPSTAAQTSSELTITATGATVGDCVILGVPATANANTCYTARVSAADTVTVKFNNYSSAAVDPASGSYKVTVLK